MPGVETPGYGRDTLSGLRFSPRKRVEENEEVEEVGEKPSGQKNQIFMDFDMLSRKKVYFCRRLKT